MYVQRDLAILEPISPTGFRIKHAHNIDIQTDMRELNPTSESEQASKRKEKGRNKSKNNK